MSANVTARPIRIYIGADNQEWTQSLVSLSIGHEKRDRRGILRITGELVLGRTLDSPESLNVRVNQARWFRGQVVRVQIQKTDLSWVDHPMGWLYIVKEPLPITPGNPLLNLQLGCIITLRDFAEPAGDSSQIQNGISKSRTEIITDLVSKAGATTFTDTLTDYPLNYPIPKESGSYINQAGEVAFACLKALYQKPDGNLGLVDLKLNPSTSPIKTITIGRDEVRYDPSEGSETPVEVLNAVGTTYKVTDTYSTIGGCGESFVPAIGKLMRRTCTYDSKSATNRIHQVVTYEPRSSLMPQQFPNDDTLDLSSDVTEIYVYEGQDANNPNQYGKLLRIESVKIELLGVALKDFYNQLSSAQQANYFVTNRVISERTTTYYSYGKNSSNVSDLTTPSEEVVASKVAVTTGLVAQVITDLDPTVMTPFSPVITGISGEYWNEIRPSEWENIRTQAQCAIVANPDSLKEDATINQKTALVTTSYEPSISSSQNQPPSPERNTGRYDLKDVPIKGTATFGTFAGSNNQPRERTIEVKYCIDNAQLQAIAQNEGALLIGRRQGQSIQLPLLDEFIDAPPMSVIHCREPEILSNGSVVYNTVIFQIDALHFIHTLEESGVAFEGIWLATIPNGETIPTLPYTPVIEFNLGIGLGLFVDTLDYSLTAAAVTINLGIGLGLQLTDVNGDTPTTEGGSWLTLFRTEGTLPNGSIPGISILKRERLLN